MTAKIRIGALISGGGTNLQAIIDACESGKIDGKVVFTGSDNSRAKGLERAVRHHIPFFVVDYAAIAKAYAQDPLSMPLPGDVDWTAILNKQRLFSGTDSPKRLKNFLAPRIVAEIALLQEMAPFRPDLIILAGYMKNLTPYFIDKINAGSSLPRIMNIHPAILPAFPGVDGYGDTWRYGCKVGGCTVHFIDYGEDSGPIIGQKTFPIEEQDSLETVREKGLRLEWELYPECIQLFAQNRLKMVCRSFDMGHGKLYTRTRVEILPASQLMRI